MSSKAPRQPRAPTKSRRQARPGQQSSRPDLRDAPRAPLPTNLSPMLATVVDRPFDRAGWVFEIKWDGYRIIALVDKGRVQLHSRNGRSFTERYHPVGTALAKIPH